MQTDDEPIQRPGSYGTKLSKLVDGVLQLPSRITRSFSLAGLPRRVADQIRLEQVNVLSMLVGVMSVMGQGTVLLIVYVTAQVFQRGQTTRRSSINLSG